MFGENHSGGSEVEVGNTGSHS